MTRRVDEILRRYGQEAAIERAEGTELVRAFLQPVRERDEEGPEPSAVGRLDGRLWLYLGKAALRTGDRVVWNGRRFLSVLQRAREAE